MLPRSTDSHSMFLSSSSPGSGKKTLHRIRQAQGVIPSWELNVLDLSVNIPIWESLTSFNEQDAFDNEVIRDVSGMMYGGKPTYGLV